MKKVLIILFALTANISVLLAEDTRKVFFIDNNILELDTIRAFGVFEELDACVLNDMPEFANANVALRSLQTTEWGWQLSIKLIYEKAELFKVLNIVKCPEYSYVRATPTGEDQFSVSLSGTGELFTQCSAKAKVQTSEIKTDSIGYSGYKLGGDDYFISITLSCSLKEGDIVNIYTTNNSEIGNAMYLYSDENGVSFLKTIPNNNHPGLHTAILGAEANGKNTICLYRHKGSDLDMNPYIAYLEIVRSVQYNYSVEFDAQKGTVTPHAGKALPLEEVTLSATPNYGYHFTQWNDGNTYNPRTITLTQDTTLTAEFSKNPSVTYNYDTSIGEVTGPSTLAYEKEGEITFTATPNEGYHFVQWSDGNTDNPRTITLTQDTTFTAEFAIDRSGKCGDDLALTWEYEPASKTLTISGEGALNSNYTYGLEAPDEAEKLVIEEGVTSIDHGAFYYCGTGCSWSQLKSVSIPTSVTYIAGKAINGVNEIHYTGTIEQWCTKSWSPSTIAYGGYSLFMADTLVTDLVIPGNVNTIENEVFSRCLSLKTITISEGADTIQNPFYYCQNLVHVTMPHSIKGIEGKAFAGCDKLEAIYVPCGDLPRFKRIFYGYHSDKLQYEPLPYSISVNTTGNGDATFVRDDSICENYLLTAIPATNHHFVHWNDGNMENPRIIKLMQDTTLTAEFAVDRSGKCGDKLALDWAYEANSKTLTISGNGSLNSNYTFGIEAPTEAVKLIISEGVTSIGNNAFSNYSTLQEISFPTTISTIGEQAFYQCTGLKHIYNYRERPCVAYSNTFDGIDKFECILYVLSASVNMYQSATAWRDFYYITTIETTNIENVQNIKGHNTKIFQNDQIVILRGDKTYTLQGQEVK